MKIISLFNNKGGVGKTTLAYHLSSALADMNHKVLMIDLDSQCNLTLYGINEKRLEEIWNEEEEYIKDFDYARRFLGEDNLKKVSSGNRSIHFLLKPTEDGLSDIDFQCAPINLKENLYLIPGRLTINQFEFKLSDQWSKTYLGDPFAIRTISKIRSIAEQYGNSLGAEYVIIDTSPNLGILNKIIISTVDGFLVPAFPDMFSLYGIQNIGNSLCEWKKEFDTIYRLISDEKRKAFPSSFVGFLGYTIYNAKKYAGQTRYGLAIAHQGYVDRIPDVIFKYISQEVRRHLSDEQVRTPIGDTAVMYTHNTYPSLAQKYKCAIWEIPSCPDLNAEDKITVAPNREKFESIKNNYVAFANAVIERIQTLD